MEEKQREPTVKDILARLDEISKIKKELQREKEYLLRKRPWYKRINFLGLMAILLTIVLFFLNYFLFSEKKELTIVYTQPTSLIPVRTVLSPDWELLLNGKPIDHVFKTEIRLKNTGNKGITKEDFIEGPLIFEISVEDSVYIKKANDKELSFLLQAGVYSGGQSNQILKIMNFGHPARISYLPSIMNPNDYADFEIYTTAYRGLKISVKGKFLDGEVINIGITEDRLGKFITQ